MPLLFKDSENTRDDVYRKSCEISQLFGTRRVAVLQAEFKYMIAHMAGVFIHYLCFLLLALQSSAVFINVKQSRTRYGVHSEGVGKELRCLDYP
jgi:hypothetical protein